MEIHSFVLPQNALRMNNWFQCRVKYLRQNENGLTQAVTEQFLVDAMSFTEAEARIMEEVADNAKEITLVAVQRSNIKEVVFYGDTDKWFKSKLTWISTDDDGEKERKVTTYILVNADTVKDAYERLEDHLKSMMVPYQIPKIEESPIAEVYEHIPGVKTGMTKVEGSELPVDEEPVLEEEE